MKQKIKSILYTKPITMIINNGRTNNPSVKRTEMTRHKRN